MLRRLKQLWTRMTMKSFSFTTEPSSKGSNIKEDLYPQMKQIVDKLESGGGISNEDLNILTSHLFNIDNIPNRYYRVNKSLMEGLYFKIDGVGIEREDKNKITDIIITLNEDSYGLKANLSISAKDFHQLLEPIPEIKQKSIV